MSGTAGFVDSRRTVKLFADAEGRSTLERTGMTTQELVKYALRNGWAARNVASTWWVDAAMVEEIVSAKEKGQ